nr:hypothetical protein [Tanacetum cinerariifolium]
PASLLPPGFLSPRIRPLSPRALRAEMNAIESSLYHSLHPSGTPPLLPISTPSTSRRAGIPEADTPPRNRPLLATPRPSTMASAIICWLIIKSLISPNMGDTPVETHQIPIVDQPSTSRPQKKQKPRRKQGKEEEVSYDESDDEDHVPTPFSDPLPSGEDSYTLNELMVFCTSLQEQVFDLQETTDAQSKEITALKKKVFMLLKWRKTRSEGLKRLMKIGSGRRVKSLLKKASFVAQEDASKQKNDDEMFGVDDLSGEELVLDTTTNEHKEQIIEDVSTNKPVTTAGEVVTTVDDKVSAAPTADVTKDEITMAQALATLKSTKPKVVVQEQEVSTIILAVATTVTTAVLTPRAKGIIFHKQKQSHIPTILSSKDKGKAKMIEPKVPIKKKDQMRMDEEYARQLEAEEQEASRLSKAQQDKEANISWDNIQAMMEADSLLAERLQAREREEFSKEQKARLLVELIEKRKKHFVALRAQEKRNKPPTKAQMKKAQKSSRKEASESSTKRTVESLESDISKKQKVDENVEQVIDDTKELKKCMEIVPDVGDEVLIEATPLSS